MKILILSCSTGEGHNSAARAISSELKRRGIEHEIADPVLFKGPRAQHFVASFYNNMIKKRPAAFGILYKAGALYDSTGILSPVYLANATYAENLNQYILKYQFTAVISTHLYGMEAMTAVRNRCQNKIPSYGVLTDYTIIPFFSEPKLDGYFIPHNDIRQKLTKRGIDSNLIHATGIPVDIKFTHRVPKEDARRALKIPTDKIILAVMSGGIGGGNILDYCDELSNAFDTEAQIYVLTGKNTELCEIIRQRYESSLITAVPFTTDVNLYMNAADILLTKPGGLSSTEAAVANVPIIHINAIPGCETENVRFFTKHHMAYYAKNAKESVLCAKQLIDNPSQMERMRAAQQAVIPQNAAEEIVRRVIEC